MEKVQFENENFILYSPDSLKYVTDNMNEIFSESFSIYFKLFDVDSFRKIQINFFDDIEKFRNFIYDLRGEKDSLPRYAVGTFDKGMINSYISPDLDIDSIKYNKAIFMASHELFHIMYKELILIKENKTRIVWFDEGMAQFFSGEKDYCLNEENFSDWFYYLIDETKEIPDLNKLRHGSGFVNERYNGYNLSLLSIKYLYEHLGYDNLKKIIHDNDKIIEYGKNIVQDAMNYYKNKLNNKVK